MPRSRATIGRLSTIAVIAIALGAIIAPVIAAPTDEYPRFAFLTRNDVPFDALAVGPIAGAVGGIVAITSPTSLSESARAAIADYAPDTVVVVGGTSAITDEVLAAIDASGDWDVVRVFGASRDATAAALAEFLASLELGRPLVTGSKVVPGNVNVGGEVNAGALSSNGAADVMGVLSAGTLDVAGNGAVSGDLSTGSLSADTVNAGTLNGDVVAEAVDADDVSTGQLTAGAATVAGALTAGSVSAGSLATDTLTVTDGATVSNLNADKLDGLDATDFVTGDQGCPAGLVVTGLDAGGAVTCGIGFGEDLTLVVPAADFQDENGLTQYSVALGYLWGSSATPGCAYAGITLPPFYTLGAVEARGVDNGLNDMSVDLVGVDITTGLKTVMATATSEGKSLGKKGWTDVTLTGPVDVTEDVAYSLRVCLDEFHFLYGVRLYLSPTAS